MPQTFDLDTAYTTDAGVLTAKLYYLATSARDITPAYFAPHAEIARNRKRHDTLKHMNPILYDHYRRTIKPTQWGGVAWVALFLGNDPVACYSVHAPVHSPAYTQTLGGYEIRNEAVRASLRGKRVASQALFPSIPHALARIDAIRAHNGMPPRGITATVAIDARTPATEPTRRFLQLACGFAPVPPHWKGTFLGDYNPHIGDSARTFCFAHSREDIPPDAINVAFVPNPPDEILLYSSFARNLL